MKIYVCGPTVYDRAHIGNLRPIITFDFYAKTLKALNQEVFLIHNITDIDDKIIRRAKEESVSEKSIALKYHHLYNKLLDTLKIDTINKKPTVTDNIAKIINFIKRLIKKKKAYKANGNVFFDVALEQEYGNLSGQNLYRLKTKDSQKFKKNSHDFALWKKTSTGITFDSPWGKGRPGWHTECVAIIDDIFNGKQIDIHAGGIDLIFPHHENEEAQFKSLYNINLAKEWKHVGQVNINKMKMSKSLGNVIDAEAFIKIHGCDVLKIIFLSTNITNPLNINEKLIINAKEILRKFKTVFLNAKLNDLNEMQDIRSLSLISQWKFAEFNRELAKKIKEYHSKNSQNEGRMIIFLANTLGFNFSNIKVSKTDVNLYKDWKKKQSEKNYEKADKIREILLKKELI